MPRAGGAPTVVMPRSHGVNASEHPGLPRARRPVVPQGPDVVKWSRTRYGFHASREQVCPAVGTTA
jgi:hypothetical protein